jgi:Fic family protein
MGILMKFDITNLSITVETLKLIAELDEFKGRWHYLSRLMPAKLKELRKIAMIESIGSSTRIEGSKLSDLEVEQLLLNLDPNSFTSRDEEEVAGYKMVCEEIINNFEAIPFTQNSIKQFHGWLLQFSHKDERHRGYYKKLSNNIEAFDAAGKSLGIIFETSSAFETPFQMEEIVDWASDQLQTKILHPLIVIGVFVVVFLAIHPFQDGNGRLSRLLTTLLLLKSGYLYASYYALENIIEHNKDGYYLALRRTQQSLKSAITDFNPWLLFFLRSLQKQKAHLEHKMAYAKMLDLNMSSPLSTQIIALVNDHGKLTISQMESLIDTNRNTLKKQLTVLVKNGHLKQLGRGRGTWYTLV